MTNPTNIMRCEVRVVHLARATARRSLMEAELARVGISADGWGAVDASEPTNAQHLAAMPDSGAWGAMHGHAKGCLASHLDALAVFLQGDASHLLMLEDDVFLADDLAEWVRGDYWPQRADLIKLERWRDDRLKIVLDRKAHRHAGRNIQRLRTRHSGSAGYIITRAGAQIVLSSGLLSLPIDHLLFNPFVSPVARRLATYQVSPALVVQGNEPAVTRNGNARKARKSLGHKLKRFTAELAVLRQVPRLVLGTSHLTSVAWRSNGQSQSDSQHTSKG
jgi:glycosyl transferase family 25